MISVLIVDDHPMVRTGLNRIVSFEEDLYVCAEADNFDGMIKSLSTNKVNIVLLDISMPGITGFEALPILKTSYPKLSIIMISSLSEEIYATKCIKAGAAGFLSKESSPEELPKAIRKVYNGGYYISSNIIEKHLLNKTDLFDNEQLHKKLSEREFQVFIQIGVGKSLKQVAETLNLSPKTISTYRTRIMNKFNFTSNAEIVKYCIENKLID